MNKLTHTQSSPLSLALAICLAPLMMAPIGCHRTNHESRSSRTEAASPEDDILGVGDGIVLKDVFDGAWILTPAPSAKALHPPPGSTDIGQGSPILISFTESIDPTNVDRNRLGISGSDGSFPEFDIEFLLDQTAIALLPQQPLEPQTEYRVVVREGITDLTGHPLRAFEFSFSTGSPNAPFTALAIEGSEGQGYLSTCGDIVAVFEEPVRIGEANGSATLPWNFQVQIDGQAVAGEFQVSGGNRIITFTPADDFSSAQNIDVKLSQRIVSEFGRALEKGPIEREFRTLPFSDPQEIALVNADPIERPESAEGVILPDNLRRFVSDIVFDESGIDFFGLLFLDKTAENGLRFEGKVSPWISDLEPAPQEPALGDGIVIMGAYAEKEGVRSPIQVTKKLFKDTEGLSIQGLSPFLESDPALQYVTQTSIAVFGQTNQPGSSLSLSIQGSNAEAIPGLESEPVFTGQVTLDEGSLSSQDLDYFVTSPIEIPLTDDPLLIEGGDSEDMFGNKGVVETNAATIQRVDYVGLPSSKTQGLLVTVYDANTLEPIEGADVIVESFPVTRDSNRVSRVSPADFSAADLELVGEELLTITVVRNSYNLVSHAGVRNPLFGEPIAVSVGISPAAISETQPLDVHLNSGDEIVRVASNWARLDDSGAAFTPLQAAEAIDLLGVQGSRPRLFTALAEFEENFRVVFSSPTFSTRNPLALDLEQGFVLDSVNDPSVRLVIQREQADGSGVYDPENPCAEGRCINRIEARLIAKLPGFQEALPIFLDTKFSRTGQDEFESEGILLLPNEFLTNQVPDSEFTQEDSPLELLIQPSLINDDEVVDPERLERSIWTEFAIGNEDGRLSVARSPLDFTQLDRPVAWFEEIELIGVPTITAPTEQVHPPTLSWISTIEKEGIYLLNLFRPDASIDPDRPSRGTFSRRWQIFLPSDLLTDPIFRFPDLRNLNDLENDVSDFAEPFSGCDLPGCDGFLATLEAISFDLDDPNDPSDDERLQFDPSLYSSSELSSEFIQRARTRNEFVIRTRE